MPNSKRIELTWRIGGRSVAEVCQDDRYIGDARGGTMYAADSLVFCIFSGLTRMLKPPPDGQMGIETLL